MGIWDLRQVFAGIPPVFLSTIVSSLFLKKLGYTYLPKWMLPLLNRLHKSGSYFEESLLTSNKSADTKQLPMPPGEFHLDKSGNTKVFLNCGSLGLHPRVTTESAMEYWRYVQQDPFNNFYGPNMLYMSQVQQVAARYISSERRRENENEKRRREIENEK